MFLNIVLVVEITVIYLNYYNLLYNYYIFHNNYTDILQAVNIVIGR